VVALALARSSYLALAAHHRFETFLSLWPIDLANINQAIWNTAHGAPFVSTILDNGLRGHFDPVLMLLSPPYLVSDSIFWVFLLYSLVISSGAVAVHLLARRAMAGALLPALLALYYLTYSPLLELDVLQIRGDVLAVPLLLFAFYFYFRQRFAPFVAFCALALLCKETVAVVVVLWGGYALISRRSRRWVLAPALAGLAVIVFTLFIYHPFIQGTAYKHSGLVVDTIDLDPAVIGHLPSWTFLVTRYFLYYGLVGLLHPAPLALASPFLAGAFIWQRVLLEEMWFHCFAPAYPFLFVSVVLATGGLLARHSRSRALPVAVALALLASSGLMLVQSRALLRLPEPNEEDRALWALIRQVPPEASVAGPPLALAPLSTRPLVRCLVIKDYKGASMDVLAVDYVLVKDGPAPWSRLIVSKKGGALDADYRATVQQVRSDPAFERVDARLGWELYRRIGP